MRLLGSAAITLLAAPAARRAPPAAALAHAAGSRVLLVEDNDGMRSALHKYLADNGFECEAYADAGVALRALRRATPSTRPDLIITDVMMQGLDGIGLLRRVRSEPALCGVPVLLLTARGLAADRIAGYSAGASAYLTKPFDPEELLACCNALLANAMLSRAATTREELASLSEDVSATKQLLQLLLLQQQQQQAAAPRLTNRERTVLELVGEGMLNKEIAVRLGVSKSHVEKYVRRLLDKTSSSNRTELVRRALQLGLLRLDAPAPPGQASRHAEALLPNREGGG
ncbi:putative two component response regulator [Emiliania huxleyi CCMP1516]|uniref:Uncharacterized protein n=2 Tax=Emiliania huxleyi TaxID=2903 RepID=A0A0D3I067_EMIH1|nr:putative two component response regulator [Emiliania huxleyi CCMP1516]XP_005761632.1 putative two component response regulator [Emiliania huxleyi CCMP1516]EOD04652.1 putative two component response regulator [Emiliania huxleyi CCMP1516]EOD09203.1 putative two component response regulator [Emiliania huxleyi CCMP1516]|eukprot:XP_005757081.1 putative two component response regulator [Emiliania huxleyi CCMP1516]